MTAEKSEGLNPVVQMDDHCPPPPHVFSQIFCDLLKEKQNTQLYIRGILFLLYKWGNRRDKKNLTNIGIPHIYDAIHFWKPQ